MLGDASVPTYTTRPCELICAALPHATFPVYTVRSLGPVIADAV